MFGMTAGSASRNVYGRVKDLGPGHRLALTTYHTTASVPDAAAASQLSVRTIYRLVASRAGQQYLARLCREADALARAEVIEREELEG